MSEPDFHFTFHFSNFQYPLSQDTADLFPPPKITHNFLLSQSQQLDKFDFDKFHQNIEDAKTKGGQVHIS